MFFLMLLSSICFTTSWARSTSTYGTQSIVEHCENGGFLLVDHNGYQNCFCHGTGFYGAYCDVPCPPSYTFMRHLTQRYPTECILI